MQNPKLDAFLEEVQKQTNNNSVSKLVLSQYSGDEHDLERIIVRSVLIKNTPSLSFTYRHTTRDIIKNYTNNEGFTLIKQYLGDHFTAGFLQGSQIEMQCNAISIKKATLR